MFNTLRSIKNKGFTLHLFRKGEGFTFIEIIVTIFVTIIGILSAYTVTQQIVSYTRHSAGRLTAAYLVKEGIEIARNIRDTNWVQGEQTGYGLVGGGSGSWNWEGDYTTTTFVGTANDPCGGGVDPYNCHPYDSTHFLKILSNFYKYSSSGTPTKFRRMITINNTDPSYLAVTVLVEWFEKNNPNPYKVTARENLYDWSSP